jgi:hypothetical protein
MVRPLCLILAYSLSSPCLTDPVFSLGLHVQINNSKPEGSSGDKKGSRISFQKKETQEKKGGGGSAPSEGGDKSLRRCSSASATLGQTLT